MRRLLPGILATWHHTPKKLSASTYLMCNVLFASVVQSRQVSFQKAAGGSAAFALPQACCGLTQLCELPLRYPNDLPDFGAVNIKGFQAGQARACREIPGSGASKESSNWCEQETVPITIQTLHQRGNNPENPSNHDHYLVPNTNYGAGRIAAECMVSERHLPKVCVMTGSFGL